MKLLQYFERKFLSKKRSLFSFFNAIFSEPQGKRIFLLWLVSVLLTLFMFHICAQTNSMALTAFSYIAIFNILRLGSCFVTIWVTKQRANFIYSFGYERFEVLSVFICTALTQLGAFFIFKESFEKLIQPERIVIENQLTVLIIGSIMNFVVTHAVENKPFDMVSRVAAPNWMQDLLFDFSKSVCGYVPLLSRFLLVRLNPYVLLSNVSALCVITGIILIENSGSYEADTVIAMFIALLMCATMYPLSAHAALILLHATPDTISSQIDECLKEANTLDGLLEFRQEHFWTVSFGKYAGLLHVRIRRDANEQLILAQLTNKLSPYLHYITIQIFKDDWKSETSNSYVSPLHVEDEQFHAFRNKYLKNIPIANGNQAPYVPSYQLNKNSFGKPPNLSSNEGKRTRYKGPKIDIDFG